MQNPEFLAQEALKFLELAQKFEEEKNVENAISHYQKAADFLKQSGFLMHRIQEIYDRISELKEFTQKEALYQRAQTKAQIEQLQDQAFTLLEEAKKLEFDGFFEDAIQQNLSAINLLAQAGWSEAQLKNIRSKINKLAKDLENKKSIKEIQEQEIEMKQKETLIIPEEKPEVVGMFGQKSSVEKAEVIERFRAKKKHEEDIQHQAFAHIDAAKMFEKDKKFDNAIMNYERAIELLDSIGWSTQTKNIQILIEKLKKDKKDFESLLLEQKQEALRLTGDIEEQKVVLEKEAELKKEKLIEFETKKKQEEEIQLKAFNLIDIGNALEREKKYDQAIKKLEQAVQLLRSIEWDSYIQPITNLIENVKIKQKEEEVSAQLKEKRKRDLTLLQDSIHRKKKAQVFESANELEKKRIEYEEKRKKEVKKEQDLFAILDRADGILKEKKFDEAINEYHKALSILSDLGPGWENYISMIKNTISNAERLKHSILTKQYEEQKKLEDRRKEELEFQKQIAIQINKERDRLKSKEIIIKDREDEMMFLSERKNVAFEFLDSAIDFLKKGNYDETILNYQNAANLFAEIQWLEEIPLIEDSIREVEELQRRQNILKQRELQDSIERQKKEEEFQNQISKSLQREREKLRKKKIELMERDKKLKYREERRKAGFKLLDEAQDNVKKGNFDEAIEIIQYATNFFADIQWENEIKILQNAIDEIENRKKEAEIQNQIRFQAKLEREKQEKAFQDTIRIEMKNQKEELIKKEIVIKEKEKELAENEKKKEETFNLLEKAQNFLSHRKFDDALHIYYNIVNIFAQIQWTEEIPIIREAINSIENKKRENEINKQKLLERVIKKETEDRAFIERIVYQREREKAELLKEKDLIEKQKQLSAQNLAIQDKAFTCIENGDKLFEEESFNQAIDKYLEAIELLKEIGWEDRYLKLLHDTIQTIRIRGKEKEKESQIEFELSLKKQKEDDLFKKKISEYMLKEKKKLKDKRIEIKRREDLAKQMEMRKSEAFEIMDDAQSLLNQGDYVNSIEKYRQAELILNEINFPTGIIRDTISKIQEKKREESVNKLKEFELRLKTEQEEEIFKKQILERIEFEERKMRDKQEKLKTQEELRIFQEQKKEEAFNMLEVAQKRIQESKFDEAINLYHQAANIFKEIQWEEEIELIQKSIIAVEDKKREAELRKQQEMQSTLEREKQERLFEEKLIIEMKTQREELKQKEIKLREREKEIVYREKRKDDAFKLLDSAHNYISQGKFDEAIELYHNVANIFAQIQWKEEIPILKKAIQDIEEKRREKELLRQKSINEIIEKEKANFTFMEEIRVLRERERLRALQERDLIQKKEIITTQNLLKQQEALKLINDGYSLLEQKNYDNALDNYQNAITILTEIGWTSDYLKLLQNTINTIELRKRDLEREEKLKIESLKQRKTEEEKFQMKISDYMQREQERLKIKNIEIQKQEEVKQIMEKRKIEAFEILDAAENSFNQKHYNQAIEKYRQAELVLNEIGFPTNSVREMIHKVQEIFKEESFTKQKKLEANLQQAQEQFEFQQKMAESLKINEIKLKRRQLEAKKQKELQLYMEKRKEEAFNLLDEADIYMKQLQYDKVLDYYHAAELKLNEIAFPTESIRELILKVQEKKREYQLQKQKEFERNMQREQEEWDFQQKIAETTQVEQERLKAKELEMLKKEQLKLRLEQGKEQAFKILDEGEHFLKEQNYDNAIICYRRAGIILNELQFPTDSINNMIFKIKNLKNQKEELKNLQFQKELEKLEEEKILSALIDERKRQEREKKEAQQLALQEREKILKEQMDVRESAYSLLEQAGKYLKHHIPNYNKAISLYIQARSLLAENIGWEPEIKNLNALIQDLQQEQANFLEKKRLEEQSRLERQKEYTLFQEEVRKRRLEQEKIRREQERQYRDLIIKRKQAEQIRDDGLKFIDEGKKWAAYHDFERAYKNFNLAITKFREIGWDEEIKYIEIEIKNTKALEERVTKEEARIQSVQEQLEKQRFLEERRRKKEEAELKETIGQVSELADSIINLIEERRQEQELAEIQQEKKIKSKSKEFRKEMTNLIKMKQELMDEITKKEEENRIFQEKLEKAKEREKVDSLKRMIKEAAEKKKK
ncbi:MAG: hypothetical protein JSV23_05750 [Promethearchaeota archaeon]|nr:MAG: hypothetical protein JSV23_05750 [Candidatus Lokiarchaeota archaeon]